MSLIRFLSSGSRGLSEGAAPLGRYRLPDAQLIPNFSGTRNPFNAKTLPAQETSSPPTGVTAKAASTQAAPSSSVPFQQAARSGAGRGLAIALATVRRVLAPVKPLGLRMFDWIKRMPAGLIARVRRRRSQAVVTLPPAHAASGPVQGELSLENVRVVRNDLTDTDYEVVCAETATASPVKRAPQAAPAPAEVRTLGRLAERLFSQKTH